MARLVGCLASSGWIGGWRASIAVLRCCRCGDGEFSIEARNNNRLFHLPIFTSTSLFQFISGENKIRTAAAVATVVEVEAAAAEG